MQRKATKQSPGPTASQREFAALVKQMHCCACGRHGVIVDHIAGSSAKQMIGVKRVHVGYWYILPLCQTCEAQRRVRKREFEGEHTARGLWLEMVDDLRATGMLPAGLTDDVVEAVMLWES